MSIDGFVAVSPHVPEVLITQERVGLNHVLAARARAQLYGFR